MDIDICNLDLNIGIHHNEGFRKSSATNMAGLVSDEIEVDRAVYDFFKKEKIKSLKREFNINCMKDLLDLKKKKIKSFDVFDGTKSNVTAREHSSYIDFESKLQSTYGHILSAQTQAAVCSCFQNFCIESSSELISNYESLIFSMVNILYNCNPQKVDVQKNMPNAATTQFVGFCPFVDVNQDLLSPANPQAFAIPIDSHSKPCSLSNQQFPSKKGFMNEGHLKSNPKVSIIDLNEGFSWSFLDSSHKPEASNALLSQPSSQRRKQGTDLPTSLHVIAGNVNQECTLISRNESARSKYCGNEKARKASNNCIDAIDLDRAINSTKDSASFSFKTPKQPACGILANNTCKSPDVEFLCEKKFHDKLNNLCNNSDKLYNENMIHLRRSYRRAKKGIDEAEDLNSTDCSGNFSVVNEQYCSSGNNSTPGSIIKKYSLSKNFPVTKYEILIYLPACKLSNIHPTHDAIDADIGGVHVKFYSLGQFFIPGGKIGSFVINIICRKFFLDERPTISKKHYFFSYVGDALMRDTSDFSCVKKCFDGAASVIPLRSVKMLLFPVCSEDHWFVFVVDLKNKHFFFLGF